VGSAEFDAEAHECETARDFEAPRLVVLFSERRCQSI